MMECPCLKSVITDMQDKMFARHLIQMTRDECIEEDCEFFEDCYNDKNPNIEKNEIEENAEHKV